MKLLSFNVRCANDPDGHSIPERAPRVAAILKTQKADVVGFQEYHRRWDDSWGMVTDPAYDEMKVDRGDGEGLVLWWRKDKFRLLRKGHFWFGDDPQVPSTDWDEKYHRPRICAWLLLQEQETGKAFLYMNVHYGFGAEGQMKNAELLRSCAQKIGDYPTVIAGDFNMQPGTPGYLAMAENFRDVNVATGNRKEITFHGYGKREGSVLDYCFVTSDVTPKSFDILTETFQGKYPSDHYPIAVQIEF